jgi:hypothetical protein
MSQGSAGQHAQSGMKSSESKSEGARGMTAKSPQAAQQSTAQKGGKADFNRSAEERGKSDLNRSAEQKGGKNLNRNAEERGKSNRDLNQSAEQRTKRISIGALRKVQPGRTSTVKTAAPPLSRSAAEVVA